MLDLGLSKMALIGAVALIVIGPEKLPRVARTVGTLLGRAQRYVNDVKAEVNRAMSTEDLKAVKDTLEQAGREVEKSLNSARGDLEKNWAEVKGEMASIAGPADAQDSAAPEPPAPAYRNPGKNWRLKRGATPQWYKARQGVRRQVQSGAARVARFRPRISAPRQR